MKRAVQIILAVAAAALLAFVGNREFHHATQASPTLVAPHMDLHAEYSNDLDARVTRLGAAVTHRDDARPKLIALTFDDGPYPMFTPLLLDELKRMNVPATFFVGPWTRTVAGDHQHRSRWQ